MPVPFDPADTVAGNFDTDGFRRDEYTGSLVVPADDTTAFEWYERALSNASSYDDPETRQRKIGEANEAMQYRRGGDKESFINQTGGKTILGGMADATLDGDTDRYAQWRTGAVDSFGITPCNTDTRSLLNEYDQVVCSAPSELAGGTRGKARRIDSLLERMDGNPDIGADAQGRLHDAARQAKSTNLESDEGVRRRERNYARSAVRSAGNHLANPEVRIDKSPADASLEDYAYECMRLSDQSHPAHRPPGTTPYDQVRRTRAAMKEAERYMPEGSPGRVNLDTMYDSAVETHDMSDIATDAQYARYQVVGREKAEEIAQEIFSDKLREMGVGPPSTPRAAAVSDMSTGTELTSEEESELGISDAEADHAEYDPESGALKVYAVDGEQIGGDYSAGSPRDASNILTDEGFDLVYDLDDENGDGTLSAQVVDNPAVREPGWGSVKMNSTHVFRDSDGQWESRARSNGPAVAWTSGITVPPSARNVAPAEAAAAMGGRCILCNRELNDAEKHSGYGAKCLKKVGGN